MNQSSKLYRLQQIDSLIDQTMARLEELEKILSDRTALAQAEEASENAEVVLVAELKKLHQAENSCSTRCCPGAIGRRRLRRGCPR